MLGSLSVVSAGPSEPFGSTDWPQDDPRLRLAGHTVEDLLDLPENAPRIELVDGVMAVVPTPDEAHQDIAFLVRLWLHRHAPKQFKAVHEVGVAVAMDQTYEPDVLLLRPAEGDGDRHFFPPERVVLVVEVVSKGTRARDRILKPAAYAAAGIPHYWRIEQGPVHVYAYQLDGPDRYRIVADSAELLAVSEPFPIRMAISDITP